MARMICRKEMGCPREVTARRCLGLIDGFRVKKAAAGI
jgi:hypothetical protein